MTPDEGTLRTLLNIARSAVEARVLGTTYIPPTLEQPWDHPRPVFVTLRRADGSLRGCIGHLGASRTSLAEEIAEDAVLAATKDHRFEAVTAAELEGLTYSISILGSPEPVRSPAELDAQRYGVVVTHGSKRGVLLPAIPGIENVEQQIRIARRKAGIEDQAAITLSRFEVIQVNPDKSS